MLKLSRLKWALIILNPIVNNERLSNKDLLDLLKNKVQKSNNYLEKTLSKIKYINDNFLTKLYSSNPRT